MRRLIYLLTLAALTLGLGEFSEAQFSALPLPLSLIASPQSPNAGEKVTIRASTPTFDKNATFFRWTVDSKQRPDLSGPGKNSIQFIAGAVGSVTRVVVEAVKPGGESAQASLGVVSSDLAVTWSAETYIPKWYKGKALPSQGSVITFVAVPRIVIGGSTIPPRVLIYTWGLDDDDFALSGTGEQVFSLRLSDIPKQNYDIQLTVEDADKRIKKTERIFMVPQNTSVGIYKISPLGGIEPRSSLASTPVAPGGSFDLIAEPFFFPVSSKKSLSYRWNANGITSGGSPDNPDILTINTNENTGDQILISLSVDNGNSYISAATKAISLFLR